MPESAISSLFAIVLAAGGSARFGDQPKQLKKIDDKTLLEHAINTALAVCPLRVYTVLGYCSEDAIPIAHHSTTHLVTNYNWQSGIASSIRTGVAALPIAANAVMITLCDQAKITADDLRSLSQTWSEYPDRVCAATYDDTIGVPAIFPRTTFSQLATLEGDHGAKSLLENMAGIRTVDIPNASFDLDTAEDLKELTTR